ncbi:Helix-turn-helix domain-containing protein [Dyadobacter sp. SG02]|uniref:helix-turn-helix domain-containing protein n=1 Tax=Dyadobacter sp. SG02 TaxID=1855291 RepID=UPI0008CEF9F0|nr:helix-turn-helix domain-containing protein [Dyadobacter sp. SG02]SEI55241.1 Helix-turn-helix domain-containing protein [Dyadobacter sp. SG02]
MNQIIQLRTVSDIFTFFRLADDARHPLVTVVDFTRVKDHVIENVRVSADFYAIIFKHYPKNNIRYGRKPVDFQDGSLICMAPGQVLEMDSDTEGTFNKGWGLFFHPDLIRGTSLADKMKGYSFFSYETSEALHLSEKERQALFECISKIDTELDENIDRHSQSIIVSTIELFLSYCSRFYERQFITRKTSNSFVVGQVERALAAYFGDGDLSQKGLPTVKHLAESVNLSPGYLSDLLKRETGKNTQDHIHFYLVEEAKNILLGTDKSVGEIAYSLGFEYPQYFNKLFKRKTGKTPVQFRSLN